MQGAQTLSRALFALVPFALLLGCSTGSFTGSTANTAATSANATAAPGSGSGSGSGASATTGSNATPGPTVAPQALGGPSAPTTVNQSGTTAASSITIPANCGAAGVTQATLITKTVANATAGNYLEYTVTVTDCAGQQIPFTAAKVSFDVDATVNSEANMTYTITDAGNTANSVQGTLVNVQGSDLFGHTGGDFYHYETDKAVSFAAAANAITVRIDLGGLAMLPFGSTNTTLLDTYLAFGATAPVESTVTLTGASGLGAGGAGIPSILQNF